MNELPLYYQRPGLNVETYAVLTAQGGPGVDGDVAFYLRHAQRTGGPVLELGAGTGRVSWALAQVGLEVVGLDLSPAMLACAQAQAADMPAGVRERVQFIRGDMADFDLTRTFSLVLIPFRGFQSLTTPEQQRRCLGCIHRHLQPGGCLIIDLFDPRLDLCLPNTPPWPTKGTVRHPRTGQPVTVESVSRSTDPLRQVFAEAWRFTETTDGGEVVRQEEETLILRWTYRWEMRYLFELTGFEVLAEFSDFHESPPAYGREQLWVVRRSEPPRGRVA
jgi:SAM-dependent methyltransferase